MEHRLRSYSIMGEPGLKTTTFSFTCGLAMLGLWAVPASAASPSPVALTTPGATILAQVGDLRKEADELLAQARRALSEGNFQTADSYISRAEKLNPQYPALHFGETPKKLRDEFNKKHSPASDPGRSGFLGMGKEAPKDPFLGRQSQSPAVTVAPIPGSAARAIPDAPGLLPGNIPASQPINSFAPRAASSAGVINAGGTNAPQSGGVVPSVYSGLDDNSRVIPATGNAPLPSANGSGAAPGNLPYGNLNLNNPRIGSAGAVVQRTETLPSGNLIPPPLRTIPAQATEPATGNAAQLIRQGEQALQSGQADQALQFFREAYKNQGELDAVSRSRLQDHLQMLSRPMVQMPGGNPLQGAETNQQLLQRQISADLARVQAQSHDLWEKKKDPKKAIELLQETKTKYAAAAGLDPATRDLIKARLDSTQKQAENYLRENAAQVELDEQNNAVRGEIEKGREQRTVTDEKIVRLVDEFNQLVEEHRFAEAEITAKKAEAIAPNSLVVTQMNHQAKMLRRMNLLNDIRGQKEDAITREFADQEYASIPFSGEIQYPDKTRWEVLTKNRSERNATDQSLRRSPKEREIEQRLSTPVLMKFENQPLRTVIEYLEKTANINIHLDPQGMQAEGITSDSPVSLKVSSEIRLKSALDLILAPMSLGYVIKNDVLLITSRELTRGAVYTKTYAVADLVIPIPNFVPTGREGLVGRLDVGYDQANQSRHFMPGYTQPAPLSVAATGDGGSTNAMLHPNLLAQIPNNAALRNNNSNGPTSGIMQPVNFGPGGMGGGTQADFDSLIELIETTVQPTTWKTNGGAGDVAPFETNLTLVVSNTQEVHEQIADLLQQLRRLQDLQVTIEVRFITLSDNFFERIGVDFDFNIDDNVSFAGINSDSGPSSVIGLDSSGQPTLPLNLQFKQNSFAATSGPPIPGITFDPATAGSFGFAILSDIEAFFLIQAAQSDRRSNVLQAPKVTLFNGQSAFISDTSQRPFVTSIIPVVGDFAAAQQPVIVVLSEGTSLTVQAVVSNDRRFVRLTVVPFFSQIGDVETFTFTGSKTSTTKDSDASSGADDSKTKAKESTTFEEGTTVQLPTFAFVTVTTTVSVPDGGTVLLGGIKRLSEGRNEQGIPILSKVPYINRLFKNVSIARTTQSLMMMVTPRIIIQEEEEDKLIGATTP